MKCKDCPFVVTDDGSPYCLLQDLYTEVCLESECTISNMLKRKYTHDSNKIKL